MFKQNAEETGTVPARNIEEKKKQKKKNGKKMEKEEKKEKRGNGVTFFSKNRMNKCIKIAASIWDRLQTRVIVLVHTCPSYQNTLTILSSKQMPTGSK